MTVKAKNINNSYIRARKVVKPYTEKQLKAVFGSYCDGGDGQLSRKELKNAFSTLGSLAPGWRAIRALCHVDKNRDGFVEEAELDNLVRYAAKRSYTIK